MKKRLSCEKQTEQFCRLCFLERNESGLAEMVSEGVTYVSADRTPLCGAGEVVRQALADTAPIAVNLQLLEQTFSSTKVSEGLYSVYSYLRFRQAELFTVFACGTFLWKREGRGYRLLHLQTAQPFSGTERLQEETEELKRALAARSKEVDRMREEMSESEERYRVALAESSDVLVEIDLKKQTTQVDAEKFRRLFQCEPFDKFQSAMLVDIDKHVHPNDRQKVRELFQLSRKDGSWTNSEHVHTLDHRIKNDEKGYIWVRATTVPIRDSSGNVVKMIESIKNIDEAKRGQLEIMNAGTHDALTGMWNRVCTEELVDKYLNEPHGLSVMMVADIDGFKNINDKLGHLLGDAVIRDVSSRIKAEFDERGVVGRIGGDEFLVFLPSADSREEAKRAAERLVELLRTEKLGNNSAYSVTGSVGAACSPQDGDSYVGLFQNADRALYHVKNNGKDNAAFFTEEMAGQRYSSQEKAVIAESAVSAEDNLITYIFQVLYETPDIQTAINVILRIVGKTFDVSRAYIFENSPDNRYCTNTYEWCNEGVTEEQEYLKDIPYGVLNYAENFNENGIFYCENIGNLRGALKELLQSQNIDSVLQCSIIENGAVRGFVGFDECKSNRLWTKNEIGVLTIISKIISTFLLKKQVQDDLFASQKQLRSIMDTLSIEAYIVEPETYRLLYMNARTKKTALKAELGAPCYQAFFERDAPCPNCPMRRCVGGERLENQEFYNAFLKRWMTVQASMIEWQHGKNVCLVSVSDITKYKNGNTEEGKGK